MQLEDQVTSLKPSKKLKDLIVEQNSIWAWLKREDGSYGLGGVECNPEDYGAFTVAELGELLQDSGEPLPWYAEGVWQYYRGDARLSAKTEADARADILIYILEKKNESKNISSRSL